MTVEEQAKDTVRRCVEAFNRGDLDALHSLLADDAEIQGVMGKGLFERVAPIWRQLIEGYGMQLHIDGLIAEGNIVAARYIERGMRMVAVDLVTVHVFDDTPRRRRGPGSPSRAGTAVSGLVHDPVMQV